MRSRSSSSSSGSKRERLPPRAIHPQTRTVTARDPHLPEAGNVLLLVSSIFAALILWAALRTPAQWPALAILGVFPLLGIGWAIAERQGWLPAWRARRARRWIETAPPHSV